MKLLAICIVMNKALMCTLGLIKVSTSSLSIGCHHHNSQSSFRPDRPTFLVIPSIWIFPSFGWFCNFADSWWIKYYWCAIFSPFCKVIFPMADISRENNALILREIWAFPSVITLNKTLHHTYKRFQFLCVSCFRKLSWSWLRTSMSQNIALEMRNTTQWGKEIFVFSMDSLPKN